MVSLIKVKRNESLGKVALWSTWWLNCKQSQFEVTCTAVGNPTPIVQINKEVSANKIVASGNTLIGLATATLQDTASYTLLLVIHYC